MITNKKIKIWYHGFVRGHALLSYSCPYCFCRIERPEDAREMKCPMCDKIFVTYDKPHLGKEIF